MNPQAVTTGRFGKYLCNVNEMGRTVHVAVNAVITRTARPPCCIVLHPDDAAEYLRSRMGVQTNPLPSFSMFNVPVWVDGSATRDKGVAQVVQCPLPHPIPEDCVYHARSARRFVSRGTSLSVVATDRAETQARPCGGCRHHPSYHGGDRGCAANVERHTPGGNTVFEICACPQWTTPA